MRIGPMPSAWQTTIAIGAPAALTALLGPVSGQQRDYVFLYVALVAALGVAVGLIPALVAAASSFLLVDYFFVPPVHQFTIADHTDVVNLAVFFGAAGLVGGLGSRRRRAQLEAEALTLELRSANSEMSRLGRAQAESAAVAVRLAQAQQQVSLLSEGDRARRDLLANVSHELRTPLGSVLVAATAMLERTDLPPTLRHEVDIVVEETRRLNRLVSDMLDMSRIEGDALELRLEPVSLQETIDAAVTRLRHRSPAREVHLEVQEDPEVVADWDRLGQVLDNLLSNADRFAPPGTPIVVRAAPGKRSLAVVRIIDRGPGVAPQLRDHVFDRFVHDGSEHGGGTGLGLAIAKGIVEAHAGRIWLEDPGEGEGGRFAFSLPMTARLESQQSARDAALAGR